MEYSELLDRLPAIADPHERMVCLFIFLHILNIYLIYIFNTFYHSVLILCSINMLSDVCFVCRNFVNKITLYC